MSELNRKLRRELARAVQARAVHHQKTAPDCRSPVVVNEHGFVQPINSKAFSLSDPEDAA